ncbi:unnamed protein product [Ceutorhynchus assimilis]|uniref:Carboxylic ester hydrolase n=1 Tax=Ceutorhynchus assimilis TaxID=467358 RepID=A0A9N9QDG2_9CUCU|nr:unnamed protein product [Ceutorhynchus assimilis]
MATSISLFVVLSLLNLGCFSQKDDRLVVNLPDGKVRGAEYSTPINNFSYVGFLAIPYAEPPVGDLRYESSRPAKPWKGILNATRDAKSCITSDSLIDPSGESEDCLKINVYTPSLKPDHPLPVMVWIHGGAFRSGKSAKSFFGPDYLVEQNVVIVSLNYRLGPLSFLATSDHNLPGNLGLKDQVLALHWVQRNIEFFGGDKKKVTLFGQSAGGTSTGLHLISKRSRGLFRAAIVQSGSGTCHWAVDQNARTVAFRLAEWIPGGNYGNDTGKLKAFLKQRSVIEIMTASQNLLESTVNESLPEGIQVWPTLEPESEDAFMTESPYELLKRGEFNKVPFMIGVTSEESLLYFRGLNHVKEIAIMYDHEPERVLPFDLYPNSTNEAIAGETIRNAYLGGRNRRFADHLVAFIDYFSDNQFVRGVVKQGDLASEYVPVYLYEFAYFGGRNLTDAYVPGAEKVAHASELPYLFTQDGYNITTDPLDVLTQKRAVKLWTDFAKYLNPTPEKSELLNNVTWTTFNNQDYPHLVLNETLQMRKQIRGSIYSMWNDVYEKYGRKPIITF